MDQNAHIKHLQELTRARVMFVGDLHGNTQQLVADFGHAVVNNADAIISAGDFGIGFKVNDDWDCPFAELAQQLVNATGIPLFFIDGNHENFDYLAQWVGYDEMGVGRVFTSSQTREQGCGLFHLRRGSLLTIANTNILSMGGAISVDREWREEGVSYWLQESVKPEDLQATVLQAALHGIDILLTHDGPTTPVSLAFDYHTNNKLHWTTKEPYFPQSAIDDSWANREFIDELAKIVRAPLHFHGHFHNPYVYHDGNNNSTVVGLDRDTKEMIDHAVFVNIDPIDFIADITTKRSNATQRLRNEG